MKDVRSTVMQLSGHWGNEYYHILCLAVEAARNLPPDDFQMKRVWSEVKNQSGKSTAAISRALSRAAVDIWQRGNREKLSEIFGKTLQTPPTAKELVCALTEYLRPRAEYRCWSVQTDGAFGLTANDDYGRSVITAPFTKNRTLAQALADALNAEQRPLDTFRTQFLTGEIPGILPDDNSV